MADVRSLLRQQRAARRIDRPYAAYSDAGRLLCTLCHENVKTESLWDAHVQSVAHRQRLPSLDERNSPDPASSTNARTGHSPRPHKRKHERAESDDDEARQDEETEEDAVRKKRSRPDWATRTPVEVRPPPKDGPPSQGPAPTLTPPLGRRTSGTPQQGAELKIPSRPATPNPPREGGPGSSGGQTSSASTPKPAPVGRSPLIPQEALMTGFGGGASTAKLTTKKLDIDEAEWAAFEAELVQAPTAPPIGTYSAEAVISAAPVTAAELATRSEEEARDRRRAVADVEMEDEREEATRALETEFEEMEALEARVRRWKEKREALRQRGAPLSGDNAPPAVGEAVMAKRAEKENGGAGEPTDDDDTEEEDDWGGFRFRA